jgi:hypothetical protein
MLSPTTADRGKRCTMDRPTEGCCGTCAYLSRRVRITQHGIPRSYGNYDEVEVHEREYPNGDHMFIPKGSGASVQGEFACFRHHADLAKEIREHPEDIVTASVAAIWKNRHCGLWSKYKPSESPLAHFQAVQFQILEDDRRAFQQSLVDFESRQNDRERGADRRLTKAAIWLASIIGAAQIIASFLTMGKDSLAYRGLSAAFCWMSRL